MQQTRGLPNLKKSQDAAAERSQGEQIGDTGMVPAHSMLAGVKELFHATANALNL